jgi:hypothetical protein
MNGQQVHGAVEHTCCDLGATHIDANRVLIHFSTTLSNVTASFG